MVEKMVKDVIDYFNDVADETMIAALAEMGFVVTRERLTPTLPADVLSTGYVRLTRIDGRPLSRVKVTLAPIVSDYQITSPSTGETFSPCLSVISVAQYTDAEGYAEFSLVRGAKVRVYTTLSSATRDITVPEGTFNLLSAGLEVEADMYAAPEPPRDVLLRSDI